MKHDSFFHPLKLILGFIAFLLFAWLTGGCASLVRVEYDNPKYGGGAVEFALPQKGGYAK